MPHISLDKCITGTKMCMDLCTNAAYVYTLKYIVVSFNQIQNNHLKDLNLSRYLHEFYLVYSR